MKNNQPAFVLLGLLGLSVFCAAFFALRCNLATNDLERASTEFRDLQGQVARLNDQQVLLRNLINDAVEHGKTHPAIYSVLKNFGIQPPSAAPAPKGR
jgi:hypothetical protein